MAHVSFFRPIRAALAACLSAAAFTAGAPQAAELTVRISGLDAPMGQLGCSLFAGEDGFPMNNAKARSQWLAVQSSEAVCRFTELAPGTYAVSIGHDTNGNRTVDTNVVGYPTEQWGVSRNARPFLRAPRFDEARFEIPAVDSSITLDVKVAK